MPKYSGSNSSAGNSELFIAESSTVGKLNSFEFKNTGFEYPSDPTLEPKIKFADQSNISDTQYITDIEIIDGGYGGNDNGTTDRKYTADLCYFGGYRIGS